MGKAESKPLMFLRLIYLVISLSLAFFPVSANAHFLIDSQSLTVSKNVDLKGQATVVSCLKDSLGSQLHKHSTSGNSGEKSPSNCCNAIGCTFVFCTVSEFLPNIVVSSHKFELTNEHGIFRVFHGLNRPPSA